MKLNRFCPSAIEPASAKSIDRRSAVAAAATADVAVLLINSRPVPEKPAQSTIDVQRSNTFNRRKNVFLKLSLNFLRGKSPSSGLVVAAARRDENDGDDDDDGFSDGRG